MLAERDRIKEISGRTQGRRSGVHGHAKVKGKLAQQPEYRGIDTIVWNYLCGVIKQLEIIEEAVSKALEDEVFTSPERAAIKAMDECEALIAEYREDLKTPGLSKSAGTAAVSGSYRKPDVSTYF